MPINVSIIIVTYNSLPALDKSLASIQKSDSVDSCELILVDNNSTDDSVSVALDYFPNAKIIKNNQNFGFAKACNIGAKNASGDILLFFNPDLVIDPNAVDVLTGYISANPQAGAVAGRMRFPDGSFQATCRNFPDMTNIFLSRGSALSKIIPTEKSYTLPDYSETTEVDAVAGTLFAIRKEIFEKVGQFDERFFMYMEDTDFSYRVKLAGYENYYVPEAGGVHLWGKGSKAGHLKRSYYHHMSVWKYYLKHFPGGFSIFFLPLLLITNFLLSMVLPKR